MVRKGSRVQFPPTAPALLNQTMSDELSDRQKAEQLVAKLQSMESQGAHKEQIELVAEQAREILGHVMLVPGRTDRIFFTLDELVKKYRV